MGNLKPIDSALVKDIDYDLISPDTVGGEYIETIGAACQNPDGYASGSLFLGKENGVQHLYRATAAIAFGETIVLDTNCTYTTVSGELVSVKGALTNNQGNIAYINTNSTTASKSYYQNEQFILDGILRKAKTAISNGDALVLDSNYENAPAVTSQIISLTNKLNNTSDVLQYGIISAYHGLDVYCSKNNNITGILVSGTLDKNMPVDGLPIISSPPINYYKISSVFQWAITGIDFNTGSKMALYTDNYEGETFYFIKCIDGALPQGTYVRVLFTFITAN